MILRLSVGNLDLMIYSGVDLIRKAEQTVTRAEKLEGPRPIAKSGTDGEASDPQAALLRFAKFVNKENQKKKRVVSNRRKHPYPEAFARAQANDDLGQLLNIYA